MNTPLNTEEKKLIRAKKMMLWFGMISLTMSFAGLTSAYVVSRNRPDWIEDFQLPEAFYFSLLAIMISSLTFYSARKNVANNKNSMAMTLLFITLLLGVVFVFLQFQGFEQIIENGYYFTGKQSTITTSFIYLVIIMHLAHIIAALIALLVVIYNHYKQKYNAGQTLGIELAETFWHFVDVLWLYLFLFLYFVR
ncbi:MAG: cytochrome c oxidase subunit 3 [Flavobacteriaceae bacterium]|nr:cytochrome c oxidase subunit 3 [Flavobacteriaceae bacterium]